MAFLCSSLLSGYCILNIIGLNRHFTTLENCVLSFVLSYFFTGSITLVLLPIPQNTRTLLILTSFVLLGCLSLFKRQQKSSLPHLPSFSRKIDFLVMSLLVGFNLLSFYFMYPNAALLPNTDISRHYLNSVILGRTPELYNAANYLFSHAHESTFITLSNSPITIVQTVLVLLNLVLPLSFYVMAKQFLSKIDARLPSLATLFWILFTNSFGGFSWLYFANLKLSITGQTQLQLLTLAADKTYNGTIYGIFGLWYIPATVSIVLLLVSLLLLTKKDIPHSRYILLFSILMAVSYLTYVVTAVVFALFLSIYGIISKNKTFRLTDSIVSSIIGFLFVMIVYSLLSFFTVRISFSTPLLLTIFVPMGALIISLLIRKFFSGKRLVKIKFLKSKRCLLKILVIITFFLYAIAFFSWIYLTDSFYTSQVDAIGVVPWFMYPLMLGVPSLLSILSLYKIANNPKAYEIIAIIIAFLVFVFIVGRFISLVNLNFFDTGYWEKRFIWFLKIPLAILAPISFILLVDKLKRRTHAHVKTLASITIISILVLFGISTTFLNIDYWSIRTTNQQISSAEMEAINAFKEILDDNPKAWLATITGSSAAIASFACPVDLLVLRQLLYETHTPEMVFTQLYRNPDYSNAYLYLHNRDLEYLSHFSDSYITSYLPLLPIVFQNSEVKIYNVSKISYPQINSENVLVFPFDTSLSKNSDVAYPILSQGLYNYTVGYDLDEMIFAYETMILPTDPPQKAEYITLNDEFDEALDSWSVYKGNWSLKNNQLISNGELSEAILLSSFLSGNFTSTFECSPKSGNASLFNYVRFIYSWIDSKNFRIADVVFHTNGYIYVLFRTIENGVETTFPNWPGKNTGLQWNFNDEYTISVSVSGESNKLFINGEYMLSIDLPFIVGNIGLGNLRFTELMFDDFSISYSTVGMERTRSMADYIDYMYSGGEILLFNLNGYGFFADELFSISDTKIDAREIMGVKQRLDLPNDLSVPLLVPKHDNEVITLNNYIAGSDMSPFILCRTYGSGKLFYCNMYPIIESMQKENDQSGFNSIFKDILQDLELSKCSLDILNFDAYVKDIILNDVKIETTSLLFSKNAGIEYIDVKTPGSLRSFHNLKTIAIQSDSSLIIEANHTETKGGTGFYTIFQINSPFSVKTSTTPITLTIKDDDEEFVFDDVEYFSIMPAEKTDFQARLPKISANDVNLIKFYPQGNLNFLTNTYGENLQVNGPTTFSILLSDTYSIIDVTTLGSTFQRNPPLAQYDEVTSLGTAVFFGLLLLPVFLVLLSFEWINKPGEKKA